MALRPIAVKAPAKAPRARALPKKKGARGVSPGRRPVPSSAGKLKRLVDVSQRMKGWQQPSAALTKIEAVPTIFPSLDRVIGIGGWPVSRIGVLHGPPHHGKSSLILGLLNSFLARGHWAAFLDAERTVDAGWAKTMLGELQRSPSFFAKRPRSFEEAVDLVRVYCHTLQEARRAGDAPEDTRGILALDSLSKLVPQNLLAKLLEKGAEDAGVDGFSGASGRMIAALNSQWFKELTILLDESKVSFVAIGRERDNPEQKRGPFHRTWKLGGGKDVEFEASILGRVTREFVKVGPKVVAQRHEVKIRKNKAGHLDEPVTAFFHTTERGFDLARDLAELGLSLGVVRKEKVGKRNAYVTGDGEVIEAGDQEALAGILRTDEKLRAAVERRCREKE